MEYDAQARCAFFQELLRLQDWVVVVRVVRHFEMEPNQQGSCELVAERKEALIKILCEEDRFKTGFTSSLDNTLVHELLHLHIEPIWDDSRKLVYEQAINCISEAVCKALTLPRSSKK